MINRFSKFLLLSKLLIAMLMTYCSLPAKAAQMQITPLRLDLSAQNPIAYFTVSNQDSKPLLCKIWVQRWSQLNDEDVYSKDPSLLVVPPIIQIAPQTTQIIRVGLLKG